MQPDRGERSALVADDDEALLRIHARALTKEGYRVETAPDGDAAAAAVERGSFDLVVSDIDMPGMDGIQLLKRVRARDLDVPVVLVTGAPSLATAVQAVELGALRYLVKPVELQALVQIANDAVELHRIARAKRQRGLLLGNQVDGRYQLRRDLGRGAAGLVFEATHHFTGRSVALKVVSPDVPRSQLTELRARLMREARALAAVRHPGVVEVLDGGVLDDGTPYIVMEHLDGRTLESFLATRGKLPAEETMAMALQICAALDAVHAAGMVHRDLKPSNLLLVRDRDGQERVKMVDFGIAQVEETVEAKLTGIGALLGTPAYMAPEQLCSLDVDGRADIYALGITMFECVTGEVPYLGPYARILVQVCSDGPPPSLPREVDARLAAIVARAMAKKPEQRFANAEELASAIRQAFPNAPARTTLLGPAPASKVARATAAQRRRFARAPYATPVHVLLPFGTIDGRSEDISEGGLLIICREPCDADVRVNIRFALPMEGRVVSCEAHVRWVRAAHPENPNGPRALGVEFVNPPEALRSSVIRYIGLMGDRGSQALDNES